MCLNALVGDLGRPAKQKKGQRSRRVFVGGQRAHSPFPESPQWIARFPIKSRYFFALSKLREGREISIVRRRESKVDTHAASGPPTMNDRVPFCAPTIPGVEATG